MTFSISSICLDDLPAIAHIAWIAFKDNPHTMSHWMYPPDKEQAVIAFRLSDVTNRFTTDPQCQFVKVIHNESGKIAAYASWQIPSPKPQAEEKIRPNGEQNLHGGDEEMPEGTNKGLLKDFNAETDRMRAKYVDSGKDYVLRAIATLPEFQGQGCGSMLLRSGLEKTDAEGAKIFLEATPQGHSLYEKFGWKGVDAIVFDLGKYGCATDMVQVTTCMMREVQRVKD